VPFIGLYGVRFFADLMVRHDLLSIEARNAVAGLTNTPFKSRGNNINSSAGYHHELGNNFLVEPSAGVNVTRSPFDDLPVTPGRHYCFQRPQGFAGACGRAHGLLVSDSREVDRGLRYRPAMIEATAYRHLGTGRRSPPKKAYVSYVAG